MPLCGKKKESLEYETRFMTHCIKGLAEKDLNQLDALWDEAERNGQLS